MRASVFVRGSDLSVCVRFPSAAEDLIRVVRVHPRLMSDGMRDPGCGKIRVSVSIRGWVLIGVSVSVRGLDPIRVRPCPSAAEI